VTTGSYGSIPGPNLQAGRFSQKSWSGTDGKYETYAGGSRPKWNEYQVDATQLACDRRTWRLYRADGGVHTSYIGNSTIPLNTTVPDTRLMNKALAKILEKVKGHDFNLGVNLGTLHQTTSMVADNLVALGRFGLALKQGNPRAAAKALGFSSRKKKFESSSLSGRFLELQYGWLPFLSDSFEAMKAFEAISNGPRTAMFRSGFGQPYGSIDSSGTSNNDVIWVGGGFRRYIQFQLYEEMSFPRQLGVYDPLSIAWELVPFSFVFDWWLPFGSYLSNLNQIPFLKGRWMITDVDRMPKQQPLCVWKSLTYIGSSPSQKIIAWEGPIYTGMRTRMTRTPLASPPKVPFPRFNKHGLSIQRFSNAVALAHSIFGESGIRL